MQNLLGKYNNSDCDHLTKKKKLSEIDIESKQETYRCIVHIQIWYWKISRYLEDDANKKCPWYANTIAQQTHPSITYVV